MATPMTTSEIIIANKARLFSADCPLKIKLNPTTIRAPKNCPPNNSIPPEVASPTGNVVWTAKLLAVESKGYVNRPLKPAATKVNVGCRTSKEMVRHTNETIDPNPQIMHSRLYVTCYFTQPSKLQLIHPDKLALSMMTPFIQLAYP